MKLITSTQNPDYKSIKQLTSGAKRRRQSGKTVLEGVHLCQSYLASGAQPVACIVTESAADNGEVQQVLEALDSSVDQLLLGDSLFNGISSVENGVGLLFVINMPDPEPAGVLSEEALLLEGIQDPGNLGTILRTAAAAGVTHVYLSADSVSAWSPKVLRAGMGAHFALTIHEQSNLTELIKHAEVPVYATSLQATSSVYDKNLTSPGAWLFGNEGQGVSDELLTLCKNNLVIIPQSTQVESLNVAAAVAVCLFEQVRQKLEFIKLT